MPFPNIRSISGHFSLSQISIGFYYKRYFLFLQCEKTCFASYSLTQYEQPLHLILIDITAVLMIFFIQLSKPLFLFLLFFYFSFGCFLYFFRIFYILFYVGMFFRVPIQFYLYKLIFSFFPARKFFRLLT